ncbi:hypothetical protein TNCV_1592001 [Trichonephila clavipes]|nr:hypothetical protein TNCV_1592001 [Trichonephila clavipes]
MRAIGKGGAAARIFCGLTEFSPPPPANCGCGCTWRKRGYSSLNGVVCATPFSVGELERLSTLKLSQNIVLHHGKFRQCKDASKNGLHVTFLPSNCSNMVTKTGARRRIYAMSRKEQDSSIRNGEDLLLKINL